MNADTPIDRNDLPGRRTGFRDFARLLHQIGETRESSVKVEGLSAYLREAPPADRAWTLGLFTGRRLRRMVGTRQLAGWLAEWEGIPEWLFNECYHQVGDLAETLALLDSSPAKAGGTDGDLADHMRTLMSLADLDEEGKKTLVKDCWSGMSTHEKFVFNKLITGGFRVGVSAQTVIQALARATGLEPSVVAHRLSGNWDPATTDIDELLQEGSAGQDLSRPYPFFLAYPLEAGPDSLGQPTDWHAEWKWDGIRGQVIRRGGRSFVWSRGEELITDRFPEFAPWMEALPDGTVLDGEILAMRDGRPLPFSTLQTRIGRQKVSARQLREAPRGSWLSTSSSSAGRTGGSDPSPKGEQSCRHSCKSPRPGTLPFRKGWHSPTGHPSPPCAQPLAGMAARDSC